MHSVASVPVTAAVFAALSLLLSGCIAYDALLWPDDGTTVGTGMPGRHGTVATLVRHAAKPVRTCPFAPGSRRTPPPYRHSPSPAILRISGMSGRRKGLVFFSSPMVAGTVGSPCGTQRIDLFHPRPQRLVARLQRQGEAAIALGIFMAAIDFGVVGQGHQLGQAGPHHLRIAFEQPPAAHQEQRVAGKGIAVDDKGDGAPGMGRHLQHLHLAAVKFPARGFVHPHIDPGNARRILARTHDGRAGLAPSGPGCRRNDPDDDGC